MYIMHMLHTCLVNAYMDNDTCAYQTATHLGKCVLADWASGLLGFCNTLFLQCECVMHQILCSGLAGLLQYIISDN